MCACPLPLASRQQLWEVPAPRGRHSGSAVKGGQDLVSWERVLAWQPAAVTCVPAFWSLPGSRLAECEGCAPCPGPPPSFRVFATSASLPAAGFLAVLDVDHLPAAVDFALESAPSREHTSRVTFRVRVCLFSEATLGLVPCSLSLCISGPFEISRRAAAPRPPEAGGQRLGV